MYRKTRAEGFGAEVKRRILVGTYVLSHGYYDAYYLKAQQVRRLIADDFRARLPQVRLDRRVRRRRPRRFRIGAKTDDPVQMYLNDIFTIAGNLTGAPAMSIPCGFDGPRPAGRPADPGPSLRRGARSSTSRIAIQQVTDWHRACRRDGRGARADAGPRCRRAAEDAR